MTDSSLHSLNAGDKVASKTIFKWAINDFAVVAERGDRNVVLQSRPFELVDSNIQLQMSFEPTAESPLGENEYCSLYLRLVDLGGAEFAKLQLKLWLENTSGDKLSANNQGKLVRTFAEIGGGWGYARLVHHDVLYPPDGTFVKYDTLFVCCEVDLMLPCPNEEETQAAINAKEEELCAQGVIGSCEIKLDGYSTAFWVPKFKLMAHSDVFFAMLAPHTMEAATGIIEMKDADPASVRAFVQYLNSHSVDGVDQYVAEDLYQLADKYIIGDLKDKCSLILSNSMADANNVDRLIMAFRHNDSTFQQRVLSRLMDNPGAICQILRSYAWIGFAAENAELAREIIDGVFKYTKWL